MTDNTLQFMNTAVLAYMGDSIYEVYVRDYVIKTGQIHANRLHQSAVLYVKAESQARTLKAIFNELTETEQALVKRARNKKITSKPKNVDPVVYKWATAFEALIGYCYFAGDKGRMEEIIEKTLNLIKGEQNGKETCKE